jgi:putative ABC transport system permease protein
MQRLLFSLRLFAWFSIRQMSRHRLHAAIVLTGIALGAAVFTSVRLSVNASVMAFTQSMDLFAGKADKVLIRPGGRVPEHILNRLLALPGVKSASPLLSAYVQPLDQEGDPFLLIGIDPILDRPFRAWAGQNSDARLARMWLDLIATPASLIAGPSLALAHGWKPGSRVGLEYGQQQSEFVVLGQLAPRGLALVEGGRTAITDIATFQEFTGLFGRVDRIDVMFDPTSPAGARQALVRALPPGLILQSPSASSESGREMIRAYELNLSILSFASLFVGMYLVYSLVALNAASRRHEIAVLAALGASPRQIFGLFLTEGLLLGALGWLMAIPLSSLLTRFFIQGVSQTISTLFVRVRAQELSIDAVELVLSLGITLTVSVLAAFAPAREAMGVQPKEALALSAQGTVPRRSPRALFWSGWALILLVLPLSRLPGIHGMAIPGYVATVCLFSGFSLLAPWLLRASGALLSPLLRRAGIAAFLAARYVSISRTRSAISVGALITAVALFMALVIMIHSFRGTVEIWVRQTLSGDLFVGPKLAEINRYREHLSPRAIDGLKGLPAAVDLVPNRRFALQLGQLAYQLEAMAMERFMRHGSFIWIRGDREAARSRLIQGQGVIVSEVFANRTGLGLGDRFRAQVQEGRVDLPIVGVVRDYRTHGGVVFCDFSALTASVGDLAWGGVRIFFRQPPRDLSSALAALRREIVAGCGPHLEMVAGQAIRHEVLRIFDETFAVTTVLLFIALLVATLGIATTLAVLVLERSRQLNILYAVGGARSQIRAMIFWEAILMVLCGELAGAGCGFFLSYLLIYVINRQSFGWTFIYRLDPTALSLSLPLILLTAFAAALPAIRMVFSRPPATLLRE